MSCTGAVMRSGCGDFDERAIAGVDFGVALDFLGQGFLISWRGLGVAFGCGIAVLAQVAVVRVAAVEFPTGDHDPAFGFDLAGVLLVEVHVLDEHPCIR